jgi:hypothetical protein
MKRVNNYFISAVLLLCISVSYAFASDIDIKVAPIVCFNDDGALAGYDDVYTQLTAELQQYWFNGLIGISSLSLNQAGNIQSAFDAAAVCQSEHCDYIIYGYIKNAGQSLSAEIKLYSNPDKKIEQTFYAQDNADQCPRLITTLSDHIADYLCKKTGTEKQPVPEENYSQVISLPFTVGYWSHVNDVWSSRILGVVRGSTGIDFQPPIPLDTTRNHKHALIFRTAAGFKYAYGNPDYYTANYYSITVSTPALLAVSLNKRNQILAGFGPFYEFNILQIQEKYEEESIHYENDFGIELLLNYAFAPSDKWKICFGTTAFVPVSENIGAWMSVDVGFIYKIAEKEVTLQ